MLTGFNTLLGKLFLAMKNIKQTTAPPQYVFICSLVLLFLMISGCARNSTRVVLVPDNNNQTGKIQLSNAHGVQVIDKAGYAVTMKNQTPPENPVSMPEEEIQRLFSAVLAAEPPLPAKYILHFLQGKIELADEDKKLISEIVAEIKQRSSTDISIDGHSDTQGDDADNERLSLKRARKVETLLLENGVAPDTLYVTSHGEGNPIIPTEDNVAEPLNRRVEVIVR